MDTKFVSAIIISIIVASAVGFGVSYAMFNPAIQSLQTSAQSLQTKAQQLESEMSAQSTAQNAISGNITSLQGALTSGLASMNSSFNALQNDLTSTQSSLSSLNSSFLALNTSYTEYTGREGHVILTESRTTTTQSAVFHIQGLMEIAWNMIGNDPSSYVIIGIYAPNGTQIYAVGSSGVFGTFSAVGTSTPGDYYIRITTSNLYALAVVVVDYY